MKSHPQKSPHRSVATALLGAVALLTVAGCATSEPGYAYSQRGYARPTQVVVQDSYVYYPGYEVYYNNSRGEYVYLEGNIWVTRRDPPRRWSHDIRRAAYVRLDFHDSPQRHHADVVRHYPRNWHSDQRRDDDDRRR